jgi:hypothetical protein
VDDQPTQDTESRVAQNFEEEDGGRTGKARRCIADRHGGEDVEEDDSNPVIQERLAGDHGLAVLGQPDLPENGEGGDWSVPAICAPNSSA